MTRSRIDTIRKYGTSLYWKNKLEPYLKSINLEYIEISVIEEISVFDYYIGFVKVKTLKELEKFIEVVVLFDIHGRPEISIFPVLLNKIDAQFTDGDLLLCKI
jgi:hypothetical protein